MMAVTLGDSVAAVTTVAAAAGATATAALIVLCGLAAHARVIHGLFVRGWKVRQGGRCKGLFFRPWQPAVG